MRPWNIIDEVNFINFQLDYYYGENCWPRRYCADILGISTFCHRKYSDEKWEITNEELAYINTLLDFSNREIKRLVNIDNDKYYAGLNDIIHKHNKEENIHSFNNTTYENILDSKRKGLHLDYRSIETDKCGVYMLAQIASYPNKPNDNYFLIKVGKSVNINARTQSYYGMNPFTKVIDTMECSKRLVDSTEKLWHDKLDNIGKRIGGTEWFIVPFEEYQKFLKLGFDYKS